MYEPLECKICGVVGRAHGSDVVWALAEHFRNKHTEIYKKASLIREKIEVLEKEIKELVGYARI